MNASRIVMTALFALGCRGDRAEFPTPWEDTVPVEGSLSGWLRAELGSPLPGSGWFEADSASSGRDYARAALVEVPGARESVVVLHIGGVQARRTRLLELDIALGDWLSGPIQVDGEAAVGQLTRDDELQYVVGGTLEVYAAGASDGDVVEVAFSGLQLAEVR
ncbi:MAG: hypothetical protein AAF211_00320 [Myxococcota bacterium]